MAHGQPNTTTPADETAKLIKAYAVAQLADIGDEPDEPPHMFLAVATMDGAEAVCHLGRAMLCWEHALFDPRYRIGGDLCDPRLTEIATRLDWGTP